MRMLQFSAIVCWVFHSILYTGSITQVIIVWGYSVRVSVLSVGQCFLHLYYNTSHDSTSLQFLVTEYCAQYCVTYTSIITQVIIRQGCSFWVCVLSVG